MFTVECDGLLFSWQCTSCYPDRSVSGCYLFVCVFTLDAVQIRLMLTWWKWEQTSLLPPFILLLSGLQASLSLSLPLQSPQPYVSGLILCSRCIGPRLFCVLRTEPVAYRDNKRDLNEKRSPPLWHSFSPRGTEVKGGSSTLTFCSWPWINYQALDRGCECSRDRLEWSSLQPVTSLYRGNWKELVRAHQTPASFGTDPLKRVFCCIHPSQ